MPNANRNPSRARRRLRRLLFVWTLPLAAAVLLAAAKLISQHVIAEAALQQYAAADYEAAMNTSSQLRFANLIDPWKAPYNEGTSYLQLGALPEAQEHLREALELAPPEEQCPIRANLAIALEEEGDAANEHGDIETAHAKWQEALDILAGADDGCAESTSGRSIRDSAERILQKLQPPQPPDSQGDQSEGPDSPAEPEEGPTPDALDELENSMEENTDMRNDDLNSGGEYGVDQPDQPW